MKIGRGMAAELEYELKIKGGAVLESSARTGPLRYVHGDGKMLPGLEKRLEGLEPGDERRGEIPAREAFGTEEMLPSGSALGGEQSGHIIFLEDSPAGDGLL